jgi:hypothetical protein
MSSTPLVTSFFFSFSFFFLFFYIYIFYYSLSWLLNLTIVNISPKTIYEFSQCNFGLSRSNYTFLVYVTMIIINHQDSLQLRGTREKSVLYIEEIFCNFTKMSLNIKDWLLFSFSQLEKILILYKYIFYYSLSWLLNLTIVNVSPKKIYEFSQCNFGLSRSNYAFLVYVTMIIINHQDSLRLRGTREKSVLYIKEIFCNFLDQLLFSFSQLKKIIIL